MADTETDIEVGTEAEAEAEAARLAVCLQLASEGSTGTVQMFALHSTVHYLLETWDHHYPPSKQADGYNYEKNNDYPNIDDLSMVKVYTSGLLTVLQLIQKLLLLPPPGGLERRKLEEEHAALEGLMATATESHHTNIISSKSKLKPMGEDGATSRSSCALLPEIGKTVSKKLQMECLSLLVAIIKCNPFKRHFAAHFSPTTALQQVAREITSTSEEKDNRVTTVELKNLELCYLEQLHGLLTTLTVRMMNEEDTRGVATSAWGHLETLLLSTTSGGSNPNIILVSSFVVSKQQSVCGKIVSRTKRS